jgi:hypothetical protein
LAKLPFCFPRSLAMLRYSNLPGHCPHPGGADLDDLRICAGGMRELDHPENPVGEHDY